MDSAGEMIKSFEELTVWQKGHKLTLDIYKITKSFPKEETFGIISQIRRSSFSVPANIAEGSSRSHTKELIQMLFVALGSLSETKYYLLLSRDLDYVKDDIYKQLCKDADELARMIHGLINSLKKRKTIYEK